MTEHKFTDGEIIRALECCQTQYNRNCKECPYAKYKTHYISAVTCSSRMRSDLLDLIKRQKAEIEGLKYNLGLRQKNKKSTKAEAIKEFAEKLKFEFDDFYYSNEDALLETADLIDDLVKEMTVGES